VKRLGILFCLLIPAAALCATGAVQRNNTIEREMEQALPRTDAEFADIKPENARLIQRETVRILKLFPRIPLAVVDTFPAGPDTRAWAQWDKYREHCKITYGLTYHRRSTEKTAWRARHELGHCTGYIIDFLDEGGEPRRQFKARYGLDEEGWADRMAEWYVQPWRTDKPAMRVLTTFLRGYQEELTKPWGVKVTSVIETDGGDDLPEQP
jgi:hypothetical protein